MQDRIKELTQAAQTLVETYDAWVQSEQREISSAVEEVFVDAFTLFRSGDMPGDLRDLGQKVAELERHWSEWMDENRLSGGLTPTFPPKMVRAISSVADCLRESVERPAFRLETVAVLTAQRVPANQICRMYRWMDSRGRPELWKLDEELLDPGKHSFQIPGWLPPLERERREREEAQRQASARTTARWEQRAEADSEPAPEEIEDLVMLPDMTLKQVARMKKMKVAEVIAYCEDHGLSVPPENTSIRTAKGLYEKEHGEEAERILDAHVTLEEEILQYHEQGLDRKAIAEATGATPQKIGRVLNAVEK